MFWCGEGEPGQDDYEYDLLSTEHLKQIRQKEEN